MAQADWSGSSGSLSSGAVSVVETAAFAAPNGGGSFTQLMRSLSTSVGVVSYFYNGTGFAPAPKGGIVTGAFKRVTSGGAAGWSPFLAACWQGTGAVGDQAYVLGLSNTDPAHLILRKGPLTGGLPDLLPPVTPGDPAAQGVLRRSTDVYPLDAWVHVQLMCAVNTNHDTVITCSINDLTAHATTSPSWQAIPGMPQFIDDGAGAHSGSASFETGRMGYGCWFGDVNRIAMFDEFTITAQV